MSVYYQLGSPQNLVCQKKLLLYIYYFTSIFCTKLDIFWSQHIQCDILIADQNISNVFPLWSNLQPKLILGAHMQLD